MEVRGEQAQASPPLRTPQAVAGVTWDDVHAINAAHAKDYDAVTKEAALELLRRNSAAAAAAIRALSDGAGHSTGLMSMTGVPSIASST
jgi:hypothetical protein